MNALDGIILIVIVLAAYGGYRLGFVTRVISWLCLGMGMAGAAWLLPTLLDNLKGRSPTVLLLVAVGALAAGGFGGQAVGFVIGAKVHRSLPHGLARQADKAVGGVAGALGVLVMIWLVTPVMAQAPGWGSRAARGSTIAQAVDDLFPAAPDSLQSLRRLMGGTYPQVFDSLREAPSLGRPPASSGISDATLTRVVQSTVKVAGRACGLIQEGSGWVVGEDLIATNAHVVAGEKSTSVQPYGSSSFLAATVVAFNPGRDVAILRVPNLNRAVLPMAEPSVGQRGAVLGHPGGGPLDVIPYAIGDRVKAVGTDIYDQTRTERDVLFLSSSIRAGDSGGALVNAHGEVVGMAFAVAPDRPSVGYALAPDEVRPVLGALSRSAVATGDCIG